MTAKGEKDKLTPLYSELYRYSQNADYTNPRVLTVINKILKLNRDDDIAFKCKVTALIHQSQFSVALKEIANHPNLSSELMFEKAYCQYRLNKIQDALKTLRNVSTPSAKEKELLGQVLYRLESYEECLQVYKDLIKNTSDDFDEERETNFSAVIAALQLWTDQKGEEIELKEETYEMSYNKACLLVGKGLYQEALDQLDLAEKLCAEALDEEDDMEAELCTIYVQRAYIYQLQGRSDEALKLYNQVVKTKPSDIGLLAVASNNIISINKDQNVFDSKKKVKATNAPTLEHKLTKNQQAAMAYNRCLFYLYTNQYDHCRKQLDLCKELDKNGETCVLLQAALHCREKQIPKAVEVLQAYVGDGNTSLRIKLTIAQLFLIQGNISKACDALRDLDTTQYKPGVVSMLVGLYANMEDTDSALEVLDAAVNWYKTQGGPQNELNTLLRESTDFKMRHGRSEEATALLEDLRKANPGDVKTLAQLISAYSKFDPDRAQQLSMELPPVTEVSGSVDVDTLENTLLSVSTRQLKKEKKSDVEEKVPSQLQGDEVVKKTKKKKKKSKPPKNYDPSIAPDPERWLPIRERSHFRGRRKHKKQTGVGKGTQGATGGSNEMDASIAPNSPKPGSNPGSVPASPAPIAPRQQKPQSSGGRKQQKKKKKKGGSSW